MFVSNSSHVVTTNSQQFSWNWERHGQNDQQQETISHEETLALLQIWGTLDIQERFNDGEDREAIWQDITKDMGNQGFNHSWSQYKDYLDLLIEEFYYIYKVDCPLPEKIRENWVYLEYLQPWLLNSSNSPILEVSEQNEIKTVLKKRGASFHFLNKLNKISRRSIHDCISEEMLEHIINHPDVVQTRVMKHVRFPKSNNNTPARQEEFFQLMRENRRNRCCNII